MKCARKEKNKQNVVSFTPEEYNVTDFLHLNENRKDEKKNPEQEGTPG